MLIVRAVSKPSQHASFLSSKFEQNLAKQNCNWIRPVFASGSDITNRMALAALLISSTAVFSLTPAFAQGSPIPGSSYARSAQPISNSGQSAPLPGGGPASYAAPAQTTRMAVPSQPGKPESIYNALPLNAEDAKIRLEDLSNRLAVSRPEELKDAIYALSEWLQDVADAHWRMFKTFEKIDATKAQAAKEKEIGLKFSALKNRAKLLKADLFIKQNRYPEALGPLVEIVTTEPTSTTGQEAYKRLVDMGFSEQASGVEVAEKGAGKH